MENNSLSNQKVNGILGKDKSNKLKDEVKINPPQPKEQTLVTSLFPIDVFPTKIQEIITATNRDLNFPIDFIGSSLIYACSVAIGNTHKVLVKRGWTESAVIYLAIIARAGTNKTHPFSFALKPLQNHDANTYRRYEIEKQEFDRITNLSKGEKNKDGFQEPVKPVWNKYLLADFTPEALIEIHKFNKKGLGVYVDELASWFKNFNRYNKGSEMEFWLSSWSSQSITVDRKSGDPLFIKMPNIAVGGSLQIGLLKELAKESRSKNGFIDRILTVFPDTYKEPWSETDLSESIISSWNNILTNLIELTISLDENQNPTPNLIQFTKEARSTLFDWQRSNTSQCNEEDSELLSGSFSKMDVYVIRLALIIEMMKYACGESDKQSISLHTTQGAIKLIEYFKIGARKVDAILSNVDPLEHLPIDKRKLFESLPDLFTIKQAQEIAFNLNLHERSLWRFLKNKELFSQPSRGNYKKQIF
jgi:hypothetical protein